MRPLELAQTWLALSSSIDTHDQAQAAITLSQYKVLYKQAIKEAFPTVKYESNQELMLHRYQEMIANYKRFICMAWKIAEEQGVTDITDDDDERFHLEPSDMSSGPPSPSNSSVSDARLQAPSEMDATSRRASTDTDAKQRLELSSFKVEIIDHLSRTVEQLKAMSTACREQTSTLQHEMQALRTQVQNTQDKILDRLKTNDTVELLNLFKEFAELVQKLSDKTAEHIDAAGTDIATMHTDIQQIQNKMQELNLGMVSMKDEMLDLMRRSLASQPRPAEFPSENDQAARRGGGTVDETSYRRSESRRKFEDRTQATVIRTPPREAWAQGRGRYDKTWENAPGIDNRPPPHGRPQSATSPT